MNMNKKILCAVILSLLSIGAVAQFRINMGEDSPLRKLQIAEMAVTNLYVDSVNEDKLVEDGIRGMLEKLDPHSSYLTAKEVKEANEPLQGNFEGIGVQFNMAEDTLLVIQPVTNGPSEKVGIIAGDRIVKVNDTIIAGVKMPKEEIMKRLLGPKGTKVVLAIVRRGIQDTLTFNVIRDKIPVHTIDAAYMVRPKVGYIRIGSFGAATHDEFVPLDTTKYTRFHRELSAKSLVINANLRYVDQHRKQLHRDYKTFDDYRQRFEVPQSVIDGIMAEAEKQNIKPKDDEELQRTLPYLRLQLKALIARDLWEMNEYFTIMGETNDILQRALQLL